MQGGMGSGSVRPLGNFRQNERVSKYVNVLGDPLNFCSREVLDFGGDIHSIHFTNKEHAPLSGQVRNILCNFSGDIRNLTD
jgi:hypothetical protein